MMRIIKQLTIYALILISVPLIAWATGWHWQQDMAINLFDYFYYLIAISASYKLNIVFLLILLWLGYKYLPWYLIVGVALCSCVLSYSTAYVLKKAFAQPRPFVVQMFNNSTTEIANFYAQPSKKRKQQIKEFYSQQSPQLESWLIKHRVSSADYSFPSGHSTYASSLLFLVAGLSLLISTQSGRKTIGMQLLLASTSIWAVLMLIGRLRLGAHFPLDLLFAVGISFVLHCIIFRFAQWFINEYPKQ